MTHELEVWLFTQRVGTLSLQDGRLRFCYAAPYLAQAGALPLSV